MAPSRSAKSVLGVGLLITATLAAVYPIVVAPLMDKSEVDMVRLQLNWYREQRIGVQWCFLWWQERRLAANPHHFLFVSRRSGIPASSLG